MSATVSRRPVSGRARPRILLLGMCGQVGWELIRTLAPLGVVRALDRAGLDLADMDAVRSAVRSGEPDIIVNAAAYTHVDRAEDDPVTANRVNGEAPGVLAAEAARTGALLVHFSTDYVFDGAARRAYSENDATGPANVYGASKLAGEAAVLETRADAYVFRVGWVYGRRGRNFLGTIEGLARERAEIAVVADQFGSPTWSRAIAEATSQAVARWLTAPVVGSEAPPRGVYHMASPDYATWHEFASAIVANMAPLDGWTPPAVRPISTAEYPTRAARPARTVLSSVRLRDTFGLELPPWREQLAQCMESA
jgi:dTDP-4-dehydrorhamnose reductase